MAGSAASSSSRSSSSGSRALGLTVLALAAAVAMLAVVLITAPVAVHGAAGASVDFYKLLGVEKHATQAEIKKAYRKRALELHPDKLGPNATEADHDAFVALAAAYEVLSDPERRERYDTHGGPADIFSADTTVQARHYHQHPFHMFVRTANAAFEFHWKPPKPARAETVTVAVEVTLQDLLKPVTKTVDVARTRWCSACGGTGASTPEHSHVCHVCDGSGFRMYLKETPSGYRHMTNTTCNVCDGTGHIFTEPCPVCGGRHFVSKPTPMNVTVPAGAPHLHTITIPGEGSQAVGYTNGDLVFVIHHIPHPKFTVDGINLVYRASISLMEALLGFKKNLTLITGTKLTVESNQVVFSGTKRSFNGLGLPRLDAPQQRGALVVVFGVRFPRKFSDHQRSVLSRVLDEATIDVLASVLELAAARAAEQASYHLTHSDFEHSSFCRHDAFVCDTDPVLEMTGQCGRP